MPPDDGNDEADEPDDGSLQQHDAGRPAWPQGHACYAGEEGLTIDRPILRCDGAGHSCLQRGTSKEAHMNGLLLLALIALALGTAPSLAQSQQPYAGLKGRAIKSLSEQQIADLRAGRGMGLALAAELNGYPGPMHVLELAEPLDLSDQQRAKMQELFTAMKAEAIPLGERLIAHEADLDKQFANKTITPASLAAATDAIG